MEGAPQFLGRPKRRLFAATHGLHDPSHASLIAPVNPDYVDTQFDHTRLPVTWCQSRGDQGTYYLQMRNKQNDARHIE
jgi:hypothetical protein